MLKFGKKIRALRDKKMNILILVLSQKIILNETKNQNPPPLQVKWSVHMIYSKILLANFTQNNNKIVYNY
jgi:lipopolysaccharide biosynthesis glycosyltransferase